MQKTSILKRCICILSILILSGYAVKAQPVEELRAVKLTLAGSNILFSDAAIAEAMDSMASMGINMVLPVVLARGYTLYPSQVMDDLFGRRIYPDFVGRDPLKRVIIEAHRNGIEVLPWFEYGFATSYQQDGGHIIQTFPEWALHDKEGNLLVKNGFDWMSGINPEVQSFIISLVTEILDNYDVDGIEFSDRMPAMPVEGGYDSVTVAIYKSEHDGALPPDNYSDHHWMRWRADKLNEFYGRVRDSIKVRGDYLINASSPNVYPWGYNQYLQDSKTWVTEGIIDHLIPQWYRYSLPEYVYEVNQTLFHTPQDKQHKIYAGMLLKYGDYLISPEFMLESIEEHRSRGVNGEAFFYYEALRQNNYFLGHTLADVIYTEPAIVPDRQGQIWRHKGYVVNEDDDGAAVSGEWRLMEFPTLGYRPYFLRANGSDFAEITYTFNVPMAGWYGLYTFIVRSISNTTQAPYTVYYTEFDSVTYYLDQQSTSMNGWQKITDIYLEAGQHTVLRLSTDGIEENKTLTADATMLMLNRKLSPDVIVSVNEDRQPADEMMIPRTFALYQNYPNPFNPVTTITYSVVTQMNITIEIFDALGRKVDTLTDGFKNPGTHSIQFDASHLTSGVYYYRMRADDFIETNRFILLK